jgi:hypothetical protein
MHRDPNDAFARWLDAERRGDDDAADQALRTAFSTLPRRSPDESLSARLMRAAVVRPRLTRSRLSERAAAAGVLAAAAAMTLLPASVLLVLVAGNPGRVVSWLARTCVWLTEWLDAGVSIWALLAQMGGAFGRVAGSSAGGAAITITLLVASTALLMLNRYMPVERS